MKNILIVEDEIITAMALKNDLQHNGYKVCTLASSGKKAIQIAKEEKPDIVLMDIRLQGEMGGIETSEEIYLKYNIPSILMSGYTEEYIKKLLKSHISFKYIMKPIELPDLTALIESILNKKT